MTGNAEIRSGETKSNGGVPGEVPKPKLTKRAAPKSGASIFDDFEQLRRENEAAFAGETEVSSSVRLGKPPKGLYFRCSTDPSMSMPAQVWVAEGDDKRTYYISSALWDLEDLAGGLKPVHLVAWLGADGSVGLWPVSAADTNEWADSARHAVAEARKAWIRIQADKRQNRYRIYYPHSPIQDRQWPDLKLSDLCKAAFGSKVVVTEDDTLIRQLRGIEIAA